MQLTVLIISFNEEKNIARCIKSAIKVADEVLVLDSGSTDGTSRIAKELGAKVIQMPFKGYAQQKNAGTELASFDWVLSLDADEELTAQLTESILKVKQHAEHHVYEFPRLTNYCGKWIRHCGWYPDRQTRLYNRAMGKWEEKLVHEYWRPYNPTKKGLLKGDLLHYSFNSISEHINKIDKYTTLSAQEAVRTGKKVNLLKLVASPTWHFIHEYFIRLGFLDGYYGLVICRLSAYASFLKCLRTLELNKLAAS